MKRLLMYRESITIIGFIILLGVVALFNVAFIAPSNLIRVANASVILLLLAAGSAPVIITRNIDVSVGSILVLSGIIGALMLTSDYAIPLVILVTILLGGSLGAMNGIIVTFGHVPSIIATLATMAAFRGISFLITGGYSIENIPTAYSSLASTSLLGLPVMVWACLVLAIILGLFMAKTRLGRHIYATGNNGEGARLIGVRTNAMVVLAYTISGLMAGAAALVFISQVGSISNQAGQGMEMRAIAAAVIGGVALSGGMGTILGASFGALFITAATSAMSFMRVPGFWSDTVIGAILLVALFADAQIRKSLDKRRLNDRYKIAVTQASSSERTINDAQAEVTS